MASGFDGSRLPDGMARWMLDGPTDIAIIATDLEGVVTAANRAVLRVLGWEPGELVGRSIDCVFTQEARVAARPEADRRQARTRETQLDEGWRMRRDGRRIWTRGQTNVMRDDDGVAVGYVIVLRDSTAQRNSSVDISSEHANIRLLLDSMAEGFYAVDVDGVTTVANGTFLRMMGLTQETAVGRKLHDVIHHTRSDGSCYPYDQCPIYRCASTGVPAHVRDEMFHPVSGPPLAVEYWAIPIIRDGELQGAICTFLDDTSRRRVDEVLRESERSLRELNADLERQVLARSLDRGMTWQVSPDLLAVLDFEGRFESVNPAFQGFLGHDEAYLRGTSCVVHAHPDDVAETSRQVGLAAAGSPVLHYENRERHVSGEYRTIAWFAAREGDRIYVRGRDVTVERAQARQLAKANEALGQSQKLEAIGQLTGGVAHDFNNLLTVIRGSADLLRRPNLSDDRRERYISAISETADRATRLTSQLLAFARRQTLKPEAFDAAGNVRALESVLATLVGPRVDLRLDLPAVPCAVSADPSQFDTAIVNMAANSRDAMEGVGSLVVSVGTSDRMPAVRAHEEVLGDFVTVTIADTGSGIASSDIERIFEPFYTTKDVGLGTGLGLSQVFGFSKQSGGEILVESEVGAGTSFTLYLPRIDPSAIAGAEAADDGDGMDETGLRVLIVEDNRDVGRFAETTLRELGYEVVLAVDACEGLTILDGGADAFDIVFSDVVMPGMTGIEMAAVIRQRHPNLPVLLTSGYSHVLAERGSGEYELLNKPYSMDQLSQALRRNVRRGCREERRVGAG